LEDYIFHEGLPPQEFKPDFEFALFNTEKHLLLQTTENWHSYSVLDKRYNTVSAIIYINVIDGVAQSPLRSPFGSYEISPDLSPFIIFQFLEFVDARLKAKGVSRIIIKEPPTLYNSERAALMHTFMLNLGYHVVDAEVGAVIQVTENSFASYPGASSRRKLRQSYNEGLVFKKLESEWLSDVYLFVLACRKQRGYSLSMSLAEIKKSADQCKEEFMFFGVFKEDKIAAATIAVQVKKDILYNFFMAHAHEFDQLSPAIMLVEGLYDYCRQNDIRLLDLGTSAVNKKPNFGLIEFKLNIGATPTSKFTFEKNFQ